MERAEKAKSPEMETAGLPPNDMKRFYVNGRHLLRETAGETDVPQNRITALNETGRFLWMQFQHPCTVAEAAAAAEAQYTGQPAEMLRGIENFVRAGLRAGLLREASAAEKTEGKAV